jgi:hypothetical protein
MSARFSPSANGSRERAAVRVWRFGLPALLLLAMCALLAGGAALVATPALSQGQSSFGHPAFNTTWQRTDGLVASGAVLRPWVWGPVPGESVVEPYQGLPGNTHAVQYFDKGRMEINDPNGDPADPFFVTNGRLAVELISGQMQTGLNRFESRGFAHINLASDVDDPSAPTYQSFNGVSSIPGAPNDRRAEDRTGQTVRDAIDRQGVTQPWPADHPDYGVKYAYFERATGHNIPDIFWTYLNEQTDIVQGGQQVRGPLFYPWFAVTGYPISEPFWSYVKVAGRYTDVLIQAYERRVLTFVPHLPSPFKVQMGNIGQHYYDWRYRDGGGQPGPGVPTPTAAPAPRLPQVTIDSINYRTSIIDLNGNYCTITNRDQQPVNFDGWWLDSPKWSHVDRFYFPSGITLAPGQSINVYSGPGQNDAENIYMFRTTVMWDGQPYDLAVLYDNYGREVTRLFPAAEIGVPPTPPPPGGTPPAGSVTPTRPAGSVTPTRPPGSVTATVAVPSPQPTGQVPSTVTPTRGTATVTPTRGTVTPTGSVTPGTVTVTPTTTVTATPTP